MLGSKQIHEKLGSVWAGQELVYKDITGSTNDDAKELAAECAVHGTLVVADRQDKGRGSRGRSWETPAGANIAMSLIVRPDIVIDRVSMLTLVMGLSVAEGVDAAIAETVAGDGRTDALEGAGNRCRIKWPNDVVLGGRKICGILTELHMSPEGRIADVVIGVGINVNMKEEDFADSIKGVAGSLLTGTGHVVDRSLVVARVMERFEENYDKFVKTSDLSLLKAQYEEKLVNKDRQVMLMDPTQEVKLAPEESVEARFCECRETGTAIGISDLGALRVRTGSGMVREVNAGEVSVRGIYGYV